VRQEWAFVREKDGLMCVRRMGLCVRQAWADVREKDGLMCETRMGFCT